MAQVAQPSKLAALCGRGASEKTGGYDALLITTGNETAVSHSPGLFDPAERERRYRLGCIQDMCYGAVVSSLHDDGVIDPEDAIGEYIPELGRRRGTPGSEIRIKDLLRHSAGYFLPPGEAALSLWQDWASMVSYLLTAQPAFPAGHVVSYAGVEAAILPELIRRVTKREPHEEIWSRLLAPAGLRGGTEPSRAYPSEISVTLRELIALVEHLRNSMGLSDGGALSEAIRSNAISTFRSERLASPFFPSKFSHGLAGFSNGTWGQNGRSQTHCVTIRFDLASDFVLALATAGTEFRRNRIAMQIAESIGGLTPLEQTPDLMGVIRGISAGTLAGQYLGSEGYSAEVSTHGDLLRCSILKNSIPISLQQGAVSDTGDIVGEAKWWTLGIEFFPHPTDGVPCMMFGPHAFRKSRV
jgi:hypothetical protein